MKHCLCRRGALELARLSSFHLRLCVLSHCH